METRHLKYFIAVAEELSFTKAAKRLNISQPPLSKQIKDLEDHLEQKLFTRNNKRVELTEVGISFLFKSYKIIKEMEETKQQLKRLHKNERKEISIGFSETALNDLISIIKSFKKSFNNINVNLHRISSPQQTLSIEDKFIDVGFICSPLSHERYNTMALNKHSYNIVLPKDHHFANYNAPIPINQLKNEAFIITPRIVSPSYYDAAFSVFNNNDFYPYKTITAYSSTAIIALIRSGLGVTLMPSSFKSSFSNNNSVIFKEITKTSYINTSIIWNPNNTPPEVEELIHLARGYQKNNLGI